MAPCLVIREKVIASFYYLCINVRGFNFETLLKFSNLQRDLRKPNPKSLDKAKKKLRFYIEIV
jgi:hypothetical protein